LTIYDGTEGCVAGLVDWMTSDGLSPILCDKSNETVILSCLCRGLLWMMLAYSFRISLCYTQCCVT